MSRASFLILLAVPAFLVFRAFFLPASPAGGPGPLAWGDAPYFYPEGLRELVSEPAAWVSRGNNFGAVNNILWLSPLMFLYGALHTFLGLGNDIIIRILFYFPAVILAFVTPVLFTRYLKLPRTTQFFASLLYGLNTYFLLLIDGGQVGVALAYGIFPLSLLFLRKLWDKPSPNNFYLALIFLVLTSIADPRIAIISLLTLFIWVLADQITGNRKLQLNEVRWAAVLVVAYVAVSSYWLLPLLKISGQEFEGSGTSFVLLRHSLLLFQPHWPLNEFGKISMPPFYFLGIPILVFGSLLFTFSRQKQVFRRASHNVLVFGLVFLLLTFLVKGESPPLGQAYQWVVANFPFGAAFRDSTKFFAPLLLFGGLLIGITVDAVGRWRRPSTLLVYIYLLFLIHPAVLGNLNFVLSSRTHSPDLGVIYERLRNDEGFFRTAWFPEKHPLTLHTQEKPALDAKELTDERPFASLNVGTFDLFNFLHREEFLDWFDLLGIKYFVFSGDHREVELNDEKRKEWNNLLELVDGIPGLERVDWDVDIPVYRNSQTKPHLFFTDKLIAVVGSDNIYQKLREANFDFSVSNQAFVFFEDGKLEPRDLQGIASESAVLVFNEKGEEDLAMSFLQKYFVKPADAVSSEWAVRSPGDYLRWKYELLVNKVDTKEFDYGRGIAFSTVKGEKISWSLDVPNGGDYILAVRALQETEFSWDISEVRLEKGIYPLTLTNDTEFAAVNVAALIPKKDWESAQDLVRQFTGHFPVEKLDGVDELEKLITGSGWQEVNFEKINQTRYKIAPTSDISWLVFTDSYHPMWKFEKGVELLPSYPFYSAVNGFYVEPNWRDTWIVFDGQREVRWGFYYTTVFALFLAITYLWKRK